MQFLGVLQSIMSINPHTATLPHPVALENVIRDRSTADISSVPPAYVSTFRPVPQAGNIAPQDRDLTDMDDAMAQDNLMMLEGIRPGTRPSVATGQSDREPCGEPQP